MKQYHIYLNGEDFGVYEAQSEAQALDLVAKDAGYKDWKTAQELSSASTDDVKIVEE